MTRPVLVSLALLSLALSAAGLASAHVTKTQGAYSLKVGWGDEPSASGTRNHVTLQVWKTDTEEGVTGLADTLNVTVTHAGQSKQLDLEESDEDPGNYSAPILPNEAGLYTVQVDGTLDASTPVHLDFAIEDVQDGNDAAFPAKNDTSAQVTQLAQQVESLQTRVAALEAKATTTSSTPATVISSSPAAKGTPGLEVGLVVAGLGAVALALAVGRRRS